MSRFPIHTLDSAPAPSKPLLHALAQAVGMVPNLAAGMAESPSLLEAFLSIRRIYERGTFSGAEVQVLSLTAAYENDCTWCMAFHSLMARKEGVAAEVVDALRAGRSPEDPRLGPLSDLARAMVKVEAPSATQCCGGFSLPDTHTPRPLKSCWGWPFR